ncbi:hypothetical protein PR048_013918 [Dryococelus australis]|uniref:Uncharacterized protein n=1 Tax=Dryococelus australis TaxID=614101 RepID=A0ABQ9HTI4_9NEOP|nr:hypothetical protein PR048_013918 [Dryococelus australis]
MRVSEVSMEQRGNAWAGETGYPEKTRRPAASSGTIPTCENPGATPPGIEPESIMLTLDDTEPIAELRGNKKRIPYCHVWGNSGGVYSSPTKVKRFRFPVRSHIFACGNRAGRRRWSVGFLRDLPFSQPLQSDVAPYPNLFTLIGFIRPRFQEPPKSLRLNLVAPAK